MADYNLNAQVNAEKGWYLFPVKGKLPYEGFMWKDMSSNDPEVIAMWIMDSRYAGCNWAVDLSKSGKTVIDIDQHPDKPNGFETAKKLGFTTAAEYSFPSISGTGQHNWYEGTYKQANGLYPGIDRKSGEGAYVVVPYELPDPDEIWQPVPAEYAIERKSNELGIKYTGSIDQWLEDHWGLPTDPEVGALVADFAIKGFTGNNLVFRVIVKLVCMALEGKGGVPEALAELEKIWMKSPHSSGNPKQEWDRALYNAIAANGGGLQEKPQEAIDEERVGKILAKAEAMKIDREAKAMVDAESHIPGETIDLRAPDVVASHLIKDFIVETGINVIFGNSNVGKTFVYMDMWASACMLGDWHGFKAKPFKTLFILGEGAHEFKKRMTVWCNHHGVDVDALIEFAVVRNGGVISSPEERAIWKDLIEKHDIKAVVYDTYSATAGLEDEDKAPQVTKAINNVRELGYDLTHIFIHHPPVSKENDEKQRLRGSGALTGRADAVINVAASENGVAPNITPAEGTSWLRISTLADHGGKKRNGRKHAIEGFYFIEEKYGLDEFGESENSLVLARAANGTSREILDILQVLSDRTMTPQTFLEEWNKNHPLDTISNDTARARLKAAVKGGHVIEEKNPNHSTGKVYKAAKPEGFLNQMVAPTNLAHLANNIRF